MPWTGRTCQECGQPATVADMDPDEVERVGPNGEGYCLQHATERGILEDGHPHTLKPGPK